VLLTHLHRDQGWAASGGVVMFPHARLWCGAADRAYFVEQLRPARRELDAAPQGRRFRGDGRVTTGRAGGTEGACSAESSG
jgi:hypothetical protein